MSRSQKKIRGLSFTIINKEKSKNETDTNLPEAKHNESQEELGESFNDDEFNEGELS